MLSLRPPTHFTLTPTFLRNLTHTFFHTFSLRLSFKQTHESNRTQTLCLFLTLTHSQPLSTLIHFHTFSPHSHTHFHTLTCSFSTQTTFSRVRKQTHSFSLSHIHHSKSLTHIISCSHARTHTLYTKARIQIHLISTVAVYIYFTMQLPCSIWQLFVSTLLTSLLL